MMDEMKGKDMPVNVLADGETRKEFFDCVKANAPITARSVKNVKE